MKAPPQIASDHSREIDAGSRFEFGKNWQAFLSTLTDERIAIAEKSLCDALEVTDLVGKRVVDVGSGSGLFSLACWRLGASVCSFDVDPHSVACTRELRSRYHGDDAQWTVQEGSILDRSFLESLGTFDLVYSWGVLHHTGSMWEALENATSLVANGGDIFIAIYNDQGSRSKFWWRVKKTYCSGRLGKLAVRSSFIPYFFVRTLATSVRSGENQFATYKAKRGMSIRHDWSDWLGGFPYQVASVDRIVEFFESRGFTPRWIKKNNGFGNNQFVFADNRDADQIRT